MQPDLRKLQDDLTALRSAAGLDPVWDRHAIRTHLLLAAAGAAAAVWAMAPHGLWPVAGMAAFAVPVADWAWRLRGHNEPTAGADREWHDSMLVLWYVVPLTILAVWSRAAGIELGTLAGLICFMLGLVLFGPAVSEPGMRPLLGWSAVLMIGGLIAPLRLELLLPVVALSICLGAIVSATWIAMELRRTDLR